MIISFEGLDGCGKSTQIQYLSNKFSELNIKTKILREPGGNRIGEKIREILLDKDNLEMCNETELLFFLASRAQLVSNEMTDLHNEGYTIILDRFFDSTTAYQGYGRGIDVELIKKLNKFVTLSGKFTPDITFFLDIPTEKSFERMKKRGEETNRMESVGHEFFERVRKGFLELSKTEYERIVLIDGCLSPEDVFAEITGILKEKGIIC